MDKSNVYYKTNYKSPVGKIVIVCDGCGENVVGLYFENQKYFCENISGKIIENNNLEIFDKVKNWLDRYFAGKKPSIKELSLKPIGSIFRQSIWKILCEISYGKITTYGDIAKQIAKQNGITKMSAQAVGGAIGHNPISIIIPCHRVIGATGNLTGYAAGLDKKIKLLKLEKIF